MGSDVSRPKSREKHRHDSKGARHADDQAAVAVVVVVNDATTTTSKKEECESTVRTELDKMLEERFSGRNFDSHELTAAQEEFVNLNNRMQTHMTELTRKTEDVVGTIERAVAQEKQKLKAGNQSAHNAQESITFTYMVYRSLLAVRVDAKRKSFQQNMKRLVELHSSCMEQVKTMVQKDSKQPNNVGRARV